MDADVFRISGCGPASRELKKRNCLASLNFILLTPSSVLAESIEFNCQKSSSEFIRSSRGLWEASISTMLCLSDSEPAKPSFHLNALNASKCNFQPMHFQVGPSPEEACQEFRFSAKVHKISGLLRSVKKDFYASLL